MIEKTRQIKESTPPDNGTHLRDSTLVDQHITHNRGKKLTYLQHIFYGFRVMWKIAYKISRNNY